jgi:dimeric dUTPase (all-alpha-NTP-PPase superfamily)
MNIQALFQIQQKLDQKITETHNLQHKYLVPDKILALQVEIGELANETRCFKFWSLKDPSAREFILEEYVDSVHFILSIGLDLGFQLAVASVHFGDLEQEIDQSITQTEAFAQLFNSVSQLSIDQSEANYKAAFKHLVHLGQILGFSWSEIERSYIDKNKVNHARQEEGY